MNGSAPSLDARVAPLLTRWFAAHGRDLPWRRTRDPYQVLVSEVMLQQTQVVRVERAWPAFLHAFPDATALAAADVAQVIRAWRGLGYNRRAVNLHRTARALVERHAGVVPDTLAALLALPGVGAYTARAVLAFAFEQPVAPIDVNVARVVQRLTGATLVPGHRQAVGDELVTAAAAPWVVTQAVMELGAVHCTARGPACGDCPVAACCAWRATGNVDPDPAAGGVVARRPPAFVGSDRWHRGRLLDALRDGPVSIDDIGVAARTEPDRARGFADLLVGEGLAEWSASTLRLPQRSVPDQ